MFQADIQAYTNAKSVFSDIYCRHCWFVTRLHVIQLDVLQNCSFLLGATHRIAEEWFIFTSYWEFTTQLNFSIHGKLYFASCLKLWTLEILLVSPVLSLLEFRKELLDPMHGDFSKSSGILLYQFNHPWRVPVLCTQAISVSSRGQQTGRILLMKDRKPSKQLLLKSLSVGLLEKCLAILPRPIQAENKSQKSMYISHLSISVDMSHM